MAAYFHILLPYQITFPESEKNQKEFDTLYKDDFIFKKRKKEEFASNDFDDYKTFYYTKNYALNPECIQKEFKSLVSIIRSSDKIQEEPKEKQKLENFLKDFQKKFFDKYTMAKYLFVAGF